MLLGKPLNHTMEYDGGLWVQVTDASKKVTSYCVSLWLWPKGVGGGGGVSTPVSKCVDVCVRD